MPPKNIKEQHMRATCECRPESTEESDDCHHYVSIKQRNWCMSLLFTPPVFIFLNLDQDIDLDYERTFSTL